MGDQQPAGRDRREGHAAENQERLQRRQRFRRRNHRTPTAWTYSIRDHGRNGILFEGEEGRLFVNRGKLDGKPVHQLKEKPLPREKFMLYQDNLSRPPQYGKLEAIVNHMGNFFDCVHSRQDADLRR